MGSSDFNVLAVARMQIFNIPVHCPRIRVACKFYPSKCITDGMCASISCTDTGHSAVLRLAYRFESEKLLNTANQVDLFLNTVVKTDIPKIVRFL
jgi:hypothetical protein